MSGPKTTVTKSYECPIDRLDREARQVYRSIFGLQRVSDKHLPSVMKIRTALEKSWHDGQQTGWVE